MEQYIGEIRMFAGNYAPVGWAFCNGQLVPISENEALFTLIGTTYGGDGQTTFGLPDLRGRVPIHQGTSRAGTNYVIGQLGGSEQVTVSINQMPAHTHAVNATNEDGTEASPLGNVWAKSITQFSNTASTGTLFQGAIHVVGNNQPHNNMMPFTAIHFIIATEGIYPMPD